MRLPRSVRRAYAALVNDHRPHPPFSWGWLNRLAESLIWDNPGAAIRPHYAWGTVFAAAQAKALGHDSVSVVEFGVAGGTGLIALQTIARDVAKTFGLHLAVHGFDTGEGLPAVEDPRDLPQLYAGGHYRMDHGALEHKLDRRITTLHLGRISDTLSGFLSQSPPPIGFCSVDVDLYTSTMDALEILRGSQALQRCLPRVVVYLDDSMGLTFGDFTGERLAVREYNDEHKGSRGVSPVYGLRYHLGWPHRSAQWPDMLYWAHLLDHPRYGAFDGLVPATEAPLRAK
jgi:hypothetical protein